MPGPPLIDFLPAAADAEPLPRARAAAPPDADPHPHPGPDDLLDAILDWAASSGLELYPHQEDAVLGLLAGDNVVLATPTGSGKSLVAVAGAFSMVAQGRRAVYTAPTKALVSEKFFELTAALGADRVGMVTGDASVNAEAPVIACTAEILAQQALRYGADTAVDLVVMDEFHYYGDRDRGWAWQVPLLELSRARFLLMSATLGDTTVLRRDLGERTGRRTELVESARRPVPLDCEYRETPLLVSIERLLKDSKTPAYIVHFTQKQATARAQSLTSLKVLDRSEKAAVKEALGGFRFDTPIGKDLRRFVLSGIGVHHAGLLPKYRLLMEKLAQQGHLRLICGTDTLGVGVNVPIRTVLFTQLYKYDGRRTRVLSVRDFQQIAGRAGRRGFDSVGSVWVQAPEHAVENKRAEMRAADDPKKRKKLVRKKPPAVGYAHYDGDTLTRLWHGRAETLKSSFHVSHAMMLNVLDRPGDGCAAMKRLLLHNHEPRTRQRRHIRRSIGVFRSLVDAGIVEVLDEPDELGRPVRVNLDLQDDFRLNQPLGLFVLEAVAVLDDSAPDYHLQALSVTESVLENPMPVLLAQRDRARTDLVNRMKAEGVEYEERMQRLAEVTWPRPESEFIEPAFDVFARSHPWVEHMRPTPKTVARDMLEHADTFNQYVSRYGLKRSEGLLLRYLTDCYKALVQTVPADAVNDDLADVIEWLSAVVRRVDSSLLDEWERLRNPESGGGDGEDDTAAAPTADITANRKAFNVMVRNELFCWVQLLARRDHDALAARLAEHHDRPSARQARARQARPGWSAADSDDASPATHTQARPGWSAADLDYAMADYWAEHDWVGIDAEARASRWVAIDDSTGQVRQTLIDPLGYCEWVLDAEIDRPTSRTHQRAVMRLLAIRRL